MAKIQEYTANRSAGDFQVAPTRSVADAAMKYEVLARNAENVSDTWGRVYAQEQHQLRQKKQEEARFEALNSMPAYRQAIYEAYQDEKTKMEPGGKGFVDNMNKRAREIYQTHLGSLTSEEARKAFAPHGLTMVDEIVRGSVVAQAEEKIRFQGEAIKGNIAKNANTIYLKPDIFTDVWKETQEQINSSAFGPELKAKGIAAAGMAYGEAFLDSALRNSPKDLAKQIKEGTINDFFKKEGIDFPQPKLDDYYQKAVNGSKQVDANQKAEQTQLMEDAIAAAANGQKVNITFDPNLFTPREIKNFESRLYAADAISTQSKKLQIASPQEAVALLQSLKPTDADVGEGFAVKQDVYEKLLKYYDGLRQAYRSDGAATAISIIQDNEVLKGEWDRAPNDKSKASLVLAVQGQAGVPKLQQTVLPKQQAQEMAQQINNLAVTKPNDLINELMKSEEMYGQYWPIVVSQLVKAGMDPKVRTLLWMGDTGFASAFASTMSLKDSDVRAHAAAIGVVEADQKALKEALNAGLAPLFSRMNAGSMNGTRVNEIAAISDTLLNMVLATSTSKKDAQARLEGVINGVMKERYEIEDTYFIPKKLEEGGRTVGVAVDRVRESLSKLKSKAILEKEGVLPYNSAINPYSSAFDRTQDLIDVASGSNGKWVVNEDQSGVYLTVDLQNGIRGMPVSRRDGSRIEYSFKDLGTALGTTPTQLSASGKSATKGVIRNAPR